MREPGGRDDGLRSEDLAAAVMTLTALLTQLRARVGLLEQFLDLHVPEFDRDRFRRFVAAHLEEAQAVTEERTLEVMRHSRGVALSELSRFFASLSGEVAVPGDGDAPPTPPA